MQDQKQVAPQPLPLLPAPCVWGERQAEEGVSPSKEEGSFEIAPFPLTCLLLLRQEEEEEGEEKEEKKEKEEEEKEEAATAGLTETNNRRFALCQPLAAVWRKLG